MAGSVHPRLSLLHLHQSARHGMGVEVPEELARAGFARVQPDPPGVQDEQDLVSVHQLEARKSASSARRAVVGFSEREGSTLYLGTSFIGPDGQVALHRRKTKPTHVERYLFGDGQCELEPGRLGTLESLADRSGVVDDVCDYREGARAWRLELLGASAAVAAVLPLQPRRPGPCRRVALL